MTERDDIAKAMQENWRWTRETLDAQALLLLDIDSDRDLRLVLRSNYDGGVAETRMSEADLLAAIAWLENVPDDLLPDRTPAGTIAQIEQMAARPKQKS